MCHVMIAMDQIFYHVTVNIFNQLIYFFQSLLFLCKFAKGKNLPKQILDRSGQIQPNKLTICH